MFVIPSHKFQVSNWEEKKSLLYKLYDNAQLTNNDPESNVHTDFTQGNYIDDVCNILNDDIVRFCYEFKLQDVRIKRVWFQRYNDGQFHQPHNHGPRGWSCILYVKFDPTVHEATRFIAPFYDLLGNPIAYTPEVKEGTILFFPSMLLHYVSPTKTDKTRVILSFNLEEVNRPDPNRPYFYKDNQ